MNFENWMATAGEKEWLDKMGIKNTQKACPLYQTNAAGETGKGEHRGWARL